MNAVFLAMTFSVAADPDWAAAEAKYLTNVKQLTFDFVRAGEGYFAPDGQSIIYQAEEKGTGNPFYQIFVQSLGTGRYARVSPGGGRTTCPFFRPDGKKIIFASGHTHPALTQEYADELARRDEERKTGKRRKYSWDFDPHVKIYEANPDGTGLKCLTPDAKAYTAEGSYSPDGTKIVYSSGPAGNVGLFIMNADGTNARKLTTVDHCYNGGPFFSPDGTKVCFRSDRKEKDRLQLYVINADGTGETALTDNDQWVYWAPFWHPDGKHLIYTAADHSNTTARPNYDLYWMNVATKKVTRITHAPGQDVLPVFSPDAKKVMWTSSRDGRSPTQLWIADFAAPRE
jgi:TolB protein